MQLPPLRISYLSNVLDLSIDYPARANDNCMISENLPVFCFKDADGYHPIELEMLDGAETLLPYLLPEEFGGAWERGRWMPQVAYDREGDVLRLFNDEPAVSFRPIADNLIIGCNEQGRPVSAELRDAARLLLPLLLPLDEESTLPRRDPAEMPHGG